MNIKIITAMAMRIIREKLGEGLDKIIGKARKENLTILYQPN